jgi:hypothetical protein
LSLGDVDMVVIEIDSIARNVEEDRHWALVEAEVYRFQVETDSLNRDQERNREKMSRR